MMRIVSRWVWKTESIFGPRHSFPHSELRIATPNSSVQVAAVPDVLQMRVDADAGSAQWATESLFERLQKSGLKPMVLSLQYHMHPSIAAFSNSAFYGGKLTNATSPAQRLAPNGASCDMCWPAVFNV